VEPERLGEAATTVGSFAEHVADVAAVVELGDGQVGAAVVVDARTGAGRLAEAGRRRARAVDADEEEPLAGGGELTVGMWALELGAAEPVESCEVAGPSPEHGAATGWVGATLTATAPVSSRVIDHTGAARRVHDGLQRVRSCGVREAVSGARGGGAVGPGALVTDDTGGEVVGAVDRPHPDDAVDVYRRDHLVELRAQCFDHRSELAGVIAHTDVTDPSMDPSSRWCDVGDRAQRPDRCRPAVVNDPRWA
jgi:hypothetical protein